MFHPSLSPGPKEQILADADETTLTERSRVKVPPLQPSQTERCSSAERALRRNVSSPLAAKDQIHPANAGGTTICRGFEPRPQFRGSSVGRAVRMFRPPLAAGPETKTWRMPKELHRTPWDHPSRFNSSHCGRPDGKPPFRVGTGPQTVSLPLSPRQN